MMLVSHLVRSREMESRHLRGMCEIAATPGYLVTDKAAYFTLYSGHFKTVTMDIPASNPTDTKHICNLNCK